VRQLLEDGTAEHAFLGLQPATLTPEIARELGVAATSGVIVVGVLPSPAERAGIKTGEVLVAFGDHKLETAEDLLVALHGARVGDRVPVKYIDHDGRERTSIVRLAEAPTPTK
jgi:S1-C subfamily serine protease